MQKLEPGSISRMNQKIVDSLANMFLTDTQAFLPWLMKSSGDFMLSGTLFFLVIMQSFVVSKRGMFFLELVGLKKIVIFYCVFADMFDVVVFLARRVCWG